jgi:hypothetical protein
MQWRERGRRRTTGKKKRKKEAEIRKRSDYEEEMKEWREMVQVKYELCVIWNFVSIQRLSFCFLICASIQKSWKEEMLLENIQDEKSNSKPFVEFLLPRSASDELHPNIIKVSQNEKEEFYEDLKIF